MLLPVSKVERDFKLTSLLPFLEDEAKIADLSFSAKVKFLCKFSKIRKNYVFQKSILKIEACELNLRELVIGNSEIEIVIHSFHNHKKEPVNTSRVFVSFRAH